MIFFKSKQNTLEVVDYIKSEFQQKVRKIKSWKLYLQDFQQNYRTNTNNKSINVKNIGGKFLQDEITEEILNGKLHFLCSDRYSR